MLLHSLVVARRRIGEWALKSCHDIEAIVMKCHGFGFYGLKCEDVRIDAGGGILVDEWWTLGHTMCDGGHE
jgi:hypothetical protein